MTCRNQCLGSSPFAIESGSRNIHNGICYRTNANGEVYTGLCTTHCMIRTDKDEWF